MTRALALLLLVALPAPALTVEVVSFGFDGLCRRGRPAPLAVRVTAEAGFRGDLVLDGGAVKRVFPLDLAPRGAAELRGVFVFHGDPAVAWRAGPESGTLALEAKQPEPGEALVASERSAVGRRADRYKLDFPPGSRFFFADFPADASPALFAAVDAVVLRHRGADREAFASSVPGLAAFRARGGAILWVGEGEKAWEGRVDPRDDASWGTDAWAVFERPAWAAGSRPYLPRLFGFALAPVLLAALAAALVPGAPRFRGAIAAAVLAAGAALAPLAAPPTLHLRESYALEFVRGREVDRLEISAATTPVKGEPWYAFAEGPVPDPVFFSRNDALERGVTVRHEAAGGFGVTAGRAEAGASVAVSRATHRVVPGVLRPEGAGFVNETDRDLRLAFVLTRGRARWIGDLPAGSLRTPGDELRIADLRSRLGSSPARRILDLWWRRADQESRWLVAFADEDPPPEGEAASRRSLGALVVVLLPAE